MARPGLLNFRTWHRENTPYTDHSYREQTVPRISIRLVRSGLQFSWSVQEDNWMFIIDGGRNYFRLDKGDCLIVIRCPYTGLAIHWHICINRWSLKIECDGTGNGKIPQSAYIDRIIKSINNRSDIQEAYKIFLAL